jgi:hypothetical protein
MMSMLAVSARMRLMASRRGAHLVWPDKKVWCMQRGKSDGSVENQDKVHEGCFALYFGVVGKLAKFSDVP